MMETTLWKCARKMNEELARLMVHEAQQISGLSRYETHAFENPETVREQTFTPTQVGFTWSRNRRTTPDDRLDHEIDVTDVTDLPASFSLGTNVWFRLQFTVPESMAGRPVSLKFIVEPQGEPSRGDQRGVYRVEAICFKDGQPWQSFDGGHDDLLLTDSAEGGEEYDLLVEVGTTALWGGLNIEEFRLEAAYIYSTRPEVEDLYRNVRVLTDLAQDVPESSPNQGRILRALFEANTVFPLQSEDEAELAAGAEEALTVLDDVKESLRSDISEFTLTTIGHAHIDVAWLWPWSETVRKCARTFSNTLKLMDEYPDFMFMQSQPLLYEFTRQRYPGVHEDILDRIGEDRWVPDGAMWIEADVNISGGEALARQYLYGKRYFRREFDIDPTVTFIPDVFGYSPALPGIAQAADCEYFLTQKMSWNETNNFPHTTFEWEGIDGSTVLAHFPPVNTYNGRMDVGEVRKSVLGLEENDVIDDAAYLIGWGDGGGGVTRDMLEKREVINDIESLPDVEFGTLTSFFEGVAEDRDALPTWRGELYLEKHRGTLTSQAQTKRNNRRGEFLIREAELWSTLAETAWSADGFSYPEDDFDTAWKILLFNQFHDILPGSSITEVYRDADRDYERMFDIVNTATDHALDAIFPRASIDETSTLCVTNSLSWQRDPVVEVDLPEDILDGVDADTDQVAVAAREGTDTTTPVQRCGDDSEKYVFKAESVPSMGTASFHIGTEPAPHPPNGLSATESRIENDLVRVEFDDAGRVASVYDKVADRESLEAPGNRFVLYRDLPEEFDAWDIEEDLYEVGTELGAPDSVEVVESGPVRAIVRQTRTFGSGSKLIQDVVCYRGEKRIDFQTYVDWAEDHKLLKTHFPIDVHTNVATYETQFGHHQRETHDNTSWDEARFEEAHQKWVDVAEPGFGAAVLNDCKYGVHVDETDVSLSLLRAPKDPDPVADQGTHTFTYSFLPHEGTFQEAGVIQAAYEGNSPTEVFPVSEPVERSALTLSDPGVVVEAVKVAEDDPEQVVLRLYEAWGRSTEAAVSTAVPMADPVELNLVEDHREDLVLDDDTTLSLSFDPFEIKTVGIRLSNE